mgnify:CR=1 FL=1
MIITIDDSHLFTQAEIEHLKNTTNKPVQILQLIAQKMDVAFTTEDRLELKLLFFMNQLTKFHDIQGKCERIKNTVFPWGYAFYTHRLVWVFGLLIPIGLIQELNWSNILVCAILSTVFITVEQVGRNLDNPFEYSFNDTPMSALCRTIEIDLLEQLKESHTLKPVTPQNGVLF